MFNIKKFFGKHGYTIITSLLIMVIIIMAIYFSIQLPTIEEFGWDWGNSIAFFVGMISISIAIFTLLQNNLQLDKQLKHDKKENSIFTFKTKIDDIFLYKSKKRGLKISTTDELYKSLDKHWNNKLFFDINTKSKLFYYFVELKNKPMVFNYLKKEIRDNINSYIANYQDIRFYTQHIISRKKNSDSLFKQFESGKKRFQPEEIKHDSENKINNEKRYGLSIFKHKKEYIEKSRISIEWNFLVKGYPSDEIVGNSCELDIYLNLEDEIITEFNKILKNIFKNCESEYNKFGND